MPDRDVVESQEITIVALLREGQPKDTKVQFKLKYGDKEEEKEGQLTGDKERPTDKAATVKLKAPEVPADQEKVEITYSVVHEKRELSLAEKIVVWPKEGKLTAVDAADGKTKLKGFAYKVVQKQKNPTPPALRANDEGKATFPLKPGEAFEVEAVAPFVITDIDKTKPRDLKITAERKYTAIFDAPAIPDSKTIKQYVNQPRTDLGQKGKGRRVLLRVMAKEDKDKKGELIAGPGVFAYVRGTFSGHGGNASARVEAQAPKQPQLLAGRQLSDVKEDTSDPNKKGVYLARLELKNGGKGEFEVELGIAGGDTCLIEVGSTPQFNDNCSVTFTNWRKVFYEVRAPDTMTLPAKAISGKQHKDMPAATTQRMAAQTATAYIEWELVSGEPFQVTDVMRANKQVLPGTFVGRPEANIFQLSDNQATKLLRAWPRATGGKPMARFILCDTNYYQSDDSGEGTAANPIKLADNTETKELSLAVSKGHWLPRSDHDGSKIEVKWTAAHVLNQQPVALTFDPDVTAVNGSTDKKRILKVTEKHGNTSQTIEFVKPVLGHITTDVEDSEKKKLRGWLTPLLTDDARAARQDQLRLEVAGESDNERKLKRLSNTRAVLTALVNEIAPAKDFHPGVNRTGQQPRTGTLDPDLVVDMTKSTTRKIVIDLPDETPGAPGNLVGPDNATTCPISVTVKYHYHASGLGTTYGAADIRGDLLIVNDSAGTLCTADTILHELGHLFGNTPFDVDKDGYAPGVDKCKSIADDEVDPWKHVGDKGHLYSEHGHTGPHCAWGLSDAEKATADYSDGSNVASGSAACVMFGEGPSVDSQRVGSVDLCLQCLHLMRARDYGKF
jgi:hypothetical protein